MTKIPSLPRTPTPDPLPSREEIPSVSDDLVHIPKAQGQTVGYTLDGTPFVISNAALEIDDRLTRLLDEPLTIEGFGSFTISGRIVSVHRP